MSQTYTQIQKKIETLQRQADKLREREADGVISRIKIAIKHYGLTAEQLGFGTRRDAVKSGKSKGDRSAKFGDGQGNYWSGRGPRPHWLRDALNAGKSLDDYALAGSTASAPSAPSAASPAKKTKLAKRRPSSVLYRDDAGHTWTGRGPQPRWMTEALASGKTREELAG
jgi:DNA-binding protein H-NS